MPTDITEAKQDVNTSVKPLGTSGTITEEESKQRETKVRSDALADINRYKAEAEKAIKAANAASERVDRMLREQEEAALEAKKDDPEAIKRIRAEQKMRQLESELESERQGKAELEERQKQTDAEKAEASRIRQATEIATRLNVDSGKLIKLAKFTDGTAEAIEDIAKDLPKLTPAKPGMKPDSNLSGGGQMSWEAVRDAFSKNPYDPMSRKRYYEMRAERGG